MPLIFQIQTTKMSQIIAFLRIIAVAALLIVLLQKFFDFSFFPTELLYVAAIGFSLAFLIRLFNYYFRHKFSKED